MSWQDLVVAKIGISRVGSAQKTDMHSTTWASDV